MFIGHITVNIADQNSTTNIFLFLLQNIFGKNMNMFKCKKFIIAK